MYVCIYICLCICMYIYICIYRYMCMYIYIYYMYIYIYVYIYMYIYICIYIYVYIYIYMSVAILAQVCSWASTAWRLSPCGSSVTRPWEVLDFRNGEAQAKDGGYMGCRGGVFIMKRRRKLSSGTGSSSS